MTHPCEPTLEELINIRSTLYGQESTELNVKKIKALECQIKRHKDVRDASKEKEKGVNE
jgi:hypothetical protein